MFRPALTMVAASLWLAGCMPALKPIAASELSCTAEQVQIEESQYVKEASCGGRTAVYRYDFAKDAWSSLNKRAVFELSCELDKLTVTVLDSTTFGVSGCDAKAVYKYIRGTGFVVDTVSRAGEAPTKQTAPAPEG